jgi:hypothetical protein
MTATDFLCFSSLSFPSEFLSGIHRINPAGIDIIDMDILFSFEGREILSTASA